VFALASTLVISTCAVRAHAKSRSQATRWVGTWASSPQLEDPKDALAAPGLADATLRQVVHVSLGGNRIRVRFSNAFGTSALEIEAAHVALATDAGAIEPQSDKPLAFDGRSSTRALPGALVYSDPIDFRLPPLAAVAVTIYLHSAPDGITTHAGSRETSYLIPGNVVSAPDMSKGQHVDHWYFLNGIDVLAPDSASSIAILGDSITDGHGSTTDGNDRWPDDLARRLQANKSTAEIGVLNEGIGGNRLVHDRLGPNALARFDRDVLAQSGVRWLVVLEGINDIGTRVSNRGSGEKPASVEEILSAYQQIIMRAHSHNLVVLGATILPYKGAFYYSPDGEADRRMINDWIRTRGHFDGVIDFDAAARDSQDASQLAPSADSGDHLHPGAQGYKIMSDSIDLRLFQQPAKAPVQ
jgi:lysophospholipase L1-like esterase